MHATRDTVVIEHDESSVSTVAVTRSARSALLLSSAAVVVHGHQERFSCASPLSLLVLLFLSPCCCCCCSQAVFRPPGLPQPLSPSKPRNIVLCLQRQTYYQAAHAIIVQDNDIFFQLKDKLRSCGPVDSMPASMSLNQTMLFQQTRFFPCIFMDPLGTTTPTWQNQSRTELTWVQNVGYCCTAVRTQGGKG